MAGAQTAALPTLLGSHKASQAPEVVDQKRKPRPVVAPLEDLSEELETTDFVVRNTFIDTPALLSPSLLGFYRQREAQTCPAGHAGRLLQGGLFQDSQEPPPLQVLSTVPYHAPPPAPDLASACAAPQAAPPPLPQLGSLPSAGSALHASLQCKPCGFFHSKGCDNGTACQFCHLCPPGEKRRRQKEKFAGAPRPTAQKSRLVVQRT